MRASSLPTAVLIALLAACGGPSRDVLVERALKASPATPPPVAAEGQRTVVIETEDGTYVATSGEDVALPEAFPADVRLPADGRVVAAASLGEAITVSLRSPRALALVREDFLGGLGRAGWRQVEVAADEHLQVVGYAKPGRRLEANLVAEADGGTTLTIGLQPVAN